MRTEQPLRQLGAAQREARGQSAARRGGDMGGALVCGGRGERRPRGREGRPVDGGGLLEPGAVDVARKRQARDGRDVVVRVVNLRKQTPSRVSRQTTCVLEHLLQQTVPTTLGMPTRGVPIVVQHGGLSTEEKQQLDELGIPTLRGKHQRSDASCEARINFRVAGTVAASARPALLAALSASACTSAPADRFF